MINLERLRPTRTLLAALIGELWSVSFGALRVLVWADLREGMISLRGLSRSTRFLIILGFTLLALMVVVLVFNDVLRDAFPLLARLNGTPGRGSLLPVVLVPLTLFMFALAWSFALTGALHSHPLIRLGVLVLFLMQAASWVNTNTAIVLFLSGMADATQLLLLLAGFVPLLLVPVFFLIRWRATPLPVFEFAVLLLLVSSILALSQARGLRDWQTFGMPLFLGVLDANLAGLQGLILPLLLLIGVDIAAFTKQVSEWTADIVTTRLPWWAPFAVLALLLSWRLYGVAQAALGRVERNTLQAELPQYMGAMGIPLGVGLVWWLVWKWRSRTAPAKLSVDGVAEAAERFALPLIGAYSALQLIVFILLTLLAAVPMAVLLQSVVFGITQVVNDVLATPWQLFINVVALVGSVWLARRGNLALALYLGIFGVMHMWYEATNPGRPLEVLTWRGQEPEDFWWVLLFGGVGLFWLLRGQLSVERASRLIFLLLITQLLTMTDFIEDPYSAFTFGLAGVGYIAFGITLDVITAGSWANTGTRALPRMSRIFLYMGYVLLTVAVVNWALTSHDLYSLDNLTGSVSMVGLERFGKPMLYGIFAVTLALLPMQHEPEETAETAENALPGKPAPS